MVIHANGSYTVSSKLIQLPEILKNPHSRTLTLADHEFNVSTYDEPREEYIVKGIPEFMPKDLILSSLENTFKQGSTITYLRPIQRKLTLESGETISINIGEFIFTATNPPEITPVFMYYDINAFRIFRKNACFFCGKIDHVRKNCPQLKQRQGSTIEKNKNYEGNETGIQIKKPSYIATNEPINTEKPAANEAELKQVTNEQKTKMESLKGRKQLG